MWLIKPNVVGSHQNRNTNMRNDQNNASVLMEPTILSENCIFIPNCGGIVPAGSSLLVAAATHSATSTPSPTSTKRKSSSSANSSSTNSTATTTTVKVSIAAKKISEAAKTRRKTHYMKKLLQLKGDYCSSGVDNGGYAGIASSGVTSSSPSSDQIGGFFSSMQNYSLYGSSTGPVSATATLYNNSDNCNIMGRTKTKQHQQQQQQFDLKVRFLVSFHSTNQPLSVTFLLCLANRSPFHRITIRHQVSV